MYYWMTTYSFDNAKPVKGPFISFEAAWEDMKKAADEEHHTDKDNGHDASCTASMSDGEIRLEVTSRGQMEVTDFYIFELAPRECVVETPFGPLRAYAKHEKDTPEDFPGIYVDLGLVQGSENLLACIEWDSVSKHIQTCVYGDGNDDSPTEVIVHENLERYKYE